MKNGKDYKTAILKKSRIQKYVDFICNIICYVVDFSLTKQIPTVKAFCQPQEEHCGEDDAEKRLYSAELLF